MQNTEKHNYDLTGQVTSFAIYLWRVKRDLQTNRLLQVSQLYFCNASFADGLWGCLFFWIYTYKCHTRMLHQHLEDLIPVLYCILVGVAT